ncbi:MAG: tripartite tricarboxylate transporter TctB family protein [Alphaproteobacteria bacterium]|nr:tripartite tricarboxylate transporter TctB family protein [Alphaproteobacteria bacterium]
MSDLSSRPGGKPSLGADLVIPGLGVGLAVYFFITVDELPWEAKANALAIGGLLLLLVAVFAVRIAIKVARGEATLGFEKLFDQPSAQRKRLWLLASLIGFIALLPWLGFTPSLFLGMLASMLVMGVREPKPLIGTALGVAAACYLMFIALLDTNFPRGPVEALLAPLFGG